MVSGQLEDSLRQEIQSYVENRLGGVKQELGRLQTELNESLNRLMESQGDSALDGSVAAAIMEHLRAAHEEGIDLAAAESSRAKASSDLAIVKAGVTELDEQDTQAGILKTLVNRAASFAPRIAFFVIKGDQTNGWRGRGFQGSVGDEAIRQISFPTSANTVVGDAAKSKTTWSGGPLSHSEDHLILNRLGEEPPQRIVAIPLVVRDRPVAVLYADSAALDSEAINLEALETLVKVSSMAVELLAARTAPARRNVEAPTQISASEGPAYSPAAYIPAREYEDPPATLSQAPEAPVTEEFQITASSEPEVSEVSTPMEPQAEVATTSAPEMHTVFEPEPVVAEPASPTSRRRFGMDLELPIEVSGEEERRLHSDARRFARLLVSEIKLYNEQKVIDGRVQSDLYDRLREYIDRSREMYDKRVKPEVARKYDYFHHELVNTLAQGDAEKLGIAYPGATVTV